MADEDVSTSSRRTHQDVDDGKRPQNMIPKSEQVDEILEQHCRPPIHEYNQKQEPKELWLWDELAYLEILDFGDQHDDGNDDDLCAPMHASIHPNSISGSMSELQFLHFWIFINPTDSSFLDLISVIQILF